MQQKCIILKSNDSVFIKAALKLCVNIEIIKKCRTYITHTICKSNQQNKDYIKHKSK